MQSRELQERTAGDADWLARPRGGGTATEESAERRLSDGSDSCWSDAGSDSDSEAELVVGSRPPALEGAVVVAAQEGELVELGLGPLQPDGKAPAVLGERVQREENPLHPGGWHQRGGGIDHWPGWPRQATIGGEGWRLRGG